MAAGEQQATFFKNVRVFSICLNAEKIVARVHRAEPIPNSPSPTRPTRSKSVPPVLRFYYDELHNSPLYNYSKNQACLLLRNILLEYGLVRLRGYLGQAAKKDLGRELVPLRDMDLWKLPEVQKAFERMEHATQATDTQMESPLLSQDADRGEAPDKQSSRTRPGSSKRAATSGRQPHTSPNKRSKQHKGNRRDDPIEPSSSFGASGMSLEDER